MRIWGLNPKILCRKHLGGQWNEGFMLVGSILKGKNLKGFIEKKQITTKGLNEYMQLIRLEGLSRGYKFKEWKEVNLEPIGKIDLEYNLKDLLGRCEECKKRYLNLK